MLATHPYMHWIWNCNTDLLSLWWLITTLPFFSSCHSPAFTHQSLVMNISLKFLGKCQGVWTSLFQLSGLYYLEIASICTPSVTSCFLQNKPQNPPLCIVFPSFLIIHLVDLSSGGGERERRVCAFVHLCACIWREKTFPVWCRRVAYLSICPFTRKFGCMLGVQDTIYVFIVYFLECVFMCVCRPVCVCFIFIVLLVLLIELHMCMPFSVTLTIFQGHSSVRQF